MKMNKEQLKNEPAKQSGRQAPPQREWARLAKPVLRFTPTAWAKLHFFCHQGQTEIGGFGIASPKDLLLIEEFVTVKQDVSVASVSFDDAAVADFFERQVDLGRRPEQFARTWLHTHPGDSPNPSWTDEETFDRVFGRCEWAVMFILARNGNTYARLRFSVGPKGELLIPVSIDYDEGFAGSDHESWLQEYQENIDPGPLCFGNREIGLQWDREWPDGFEAVEAAEDQNQCEEVEEDADAAWLWDESEVW